MKNTFKTPLRGGESNQLRLLFFLRRVLLDDHWLDGRMKQMKILWRYKGIIAQLDRMVHDIAATVPEDVWERFRRAMDMQELRIGTRGGAVDPSGDLIVVPRRALYKACHQASKECMLCDGTSTEMANCSYRKALKEMSLVNIMLFENDGICMGRKIDWREM